MTYRPRLYLDRHDMRAARRRARLRSSRHYGRGAGLPLWLQGVAFVALWLILGALALPWLALLVSP